MITYDARILAEHMLENGRKWVLHPNFFSGNISKVILRISLKKMKPSRMDPGGGCTQTPPRSRTMCFKTKLCLMAVSDQFNTDNVITLVY